MQGKGKKAELLADRLEIPADALGTPKLSICGRRRVLVENHCGIVEYTPELVRIAVRRGAVSVHGSGLTIARMTRRRVEVRGMIFSVELD